MKSIEQGSDYRSFLCGCLLAGVTLLLYSPVRHFDYINFDDYGYVKGNLLVNEGLVFSNIIDSFSIYLHANWHPVTWLSYMLDFQLFGANAGAAQHMVNALLHTANSILLFIVLRSMTGATWKSFLVAALFAWHPLHVESVAWISERKDVLFTFFWLLTMWTYIRYAKRGHVIFYLLTVLFCAMALMSKPMAVTLPLVLLLMDVWPLGRFGNAGKQGIRLIFIEKLPLFLFAGFTCVQTIFAQGHGRAIAGLDQLGFLARITNSIIAYATYLWMMIRPIGLAVIYPHPFEAHYGKAVLCGLVFLIITVLVIQHWRRRPYYAIGWLWYVITLVPVIGILQVGTQALADRYTYVPLVGVFIMIAWGLGDLVKVRPALKTLVVIGCTLSLAGCLFLTRAQIFRWEDTSTLFSHTLAVTENNYKAHSCISGAFLEQENWPEAEAHLRKALQLKPTSARYRVRLGKILTEQGKYDQALSEFKEALKLNPDYEMAYLSLGQLYERQNDPGNALIYYRKSLILNPYSYDSMDRMSWILSTSPEPDIRDGQVAVHLSEMQLSFFNKPPARFLCTQAAAYAEVGRFAEALLTAEKALDIAKKEKNRDTKLIEMLSGCHEHYRQGQPYRDSSPLVE